MSDYQNLLDLCHRPFKWYEHEFNYQKHIYVKIQSTVQRLNSLGVPWSLEQGPVTIVDNPEKTSQGKPQYDAHCVVQLTIDGLGTRGAPGAHTGTDKDNVAKSAHSFAVRKAASLFGVAHYLMVAPKEEAAFVNFMHGADLTDLASLKKAVKMVAEIDGLDPLAWLSDRGITKDGVDVVSLRKILVDEGRI